MLIVFYSETGNVAEFVSKCKVKSIEIEEGSETVEEDFILITPTVGFGEVPELVEEFLHENSQRLIGVCVSGNMGWEETYCLAGDKIAEKYHVPLLLKFEDEGTEEDVNKFKTILDELKAR